MYDIDPTMSAYTTKCLREAHAAEGLRRNHGVDLTGYAYRPCFHIDDTGVPPPATHACTCEHCPRCGGHLGGHDIFSEAVA